MLFLHPTFYPGTCTIETLLEELSDISGSEWFNLGTHLGVDISTLKDIDANYRDVQRCKTEMLHVWLQRVLTNPWTKLATALKHTKNEVLAQRILEKYNTVMPKSDSERYCIKNLLWAHFWGQFVAYTTSIRSSSQL